MRPAYQLALKIFRTLALIIIVFGSLQFYLLSGLLPPAVSLWLFYSGGISAILYILLKLWVAYDDALNLRITNWPMRISLVIYGFGLLMYLSLLTIENGGLETLGYLVLVMGSVFFGNAGMFIGLLLDQLSDWARSD